ncbi:MAG: phage tail assembly protein [Betaproteobacteria bacterium]|nr:phage tail assembly protein [Betaproteobacteria bacterium]
MNDTELDTQVAPKTEETITLAQPIVRGAQTIATLVIRKPKPLNMRGMKILDILQLDVDCIVTLAQRVATPPLTDIEARNLDPADITKIGMAVQGFFVDPSAAREADNA